MILTHLDLSTAHLTEDTMNTLSLSDSSERYQLGWPALTVAAYEYGAFVTCPCWGEVGHEQLETLPPDLLEVFRYAQSQGATLVRFDADGYELPDLPTYDW